MRKLYFIVFLIIAFCISTMHANATCYMKNGKYNTSDSSGTVVDDYYCRVNECAIGFTENGSYPSKRGCGDCGNDYTWDETKNRCDLSSYAKKLNNNATCASKASTPTECSACSGYQWNSIEGCIPIARETDSPSVMSCYDYDQANCGVDGKIENGNSEKSFSCVWVTGDNTPGYCNVDKLQYVKCGDAFDIPEQAPRIMSFAINLLKIGTPIILIITGIITLVKALAASKEDEIKKATSTLIRKFIASAFVFFVIMIVQFVILKVADSSETGEISKCLSCFLNNDCSSSVYFKTKVGDSYTCHLVSNPSQVIDCGENVPLDE